jgi:hypothetical protein
VEGAELVSEETAARLTALEAVGCTGVLVAGPVTTGHDLPDSELSVDPFFVARLLLPGGSEVHATGLTPEEAGVRLADEAERELRS